jgi:tetratricopeptide (TPR) repeat protein
MLAERQPSVPQYQSDLGRVYYQLAEIVMEHPDKAHAQALQAVRYQAAALNLSPKSLDYRRWLWDDYVILSEILLRLGRIEPAARAAEELPRLIPDQLLTYLFVANRLTRCADASKGQTPDYQARAVQAIGSAVKDGVIHDAKQLEHKEFRPLKARQDFRRLVLSLATPKAA